MLLLIYISRENTEILATFNWVTRLLDLIYVHIIRHTVADAGGLKGLESPFDPHQIQENRRNTQIFLVDKNIAINITSIFVSIYIYISTRCVLELLSAAAHTPSPKLPTHLEEGIKRTPIFVSTTFATTKLDAPLILFSALNFPAKATNIQHLNFECNKRVFEFQTFYRFQFPF